MKIEFYKKSGEKDVAVEYPKILESVVTDARILEYVRLFRANSRQVSANTKGKGEVSGGGKKPWKQKGTGRARVGSSRSPIWTGGGVTFGPTSDRNFKIKLNKKEKRAALLAAIFSKVKENAALGVTDLKFSEPKTALAAKTLEKLPITGKVTIFSPAGDENFAKSFKNIPFVKTASANNIDIIAIVSSDNIVFTKESLNELAKHYTADKAEAEDKIEKVKVKKDE